MSRTTSMTGPKLLPALQLSLRAAVAAGIAVVVAKLLHLQHPVYAMISAIVVTDLVAVETRKLALPRLAGTLLGSVLGAVISMFFAPGFAVAVFGIFVAMFASHLCLESAAKVAGFVCGIVLLEHTDSPWSYALFRMIETALGIGAAMCVSVVPKLLHVKPPEQT